jgi:hypothetical protein
MISVDTRFSWYYTFKTRLSHEIVSLGNFQNLDRNSLKSKKYFSCFQREACHCVKNYYRYFSYRDDSIIVFMSGVTLFLIKKQWNNQYCIWHRIFKSVHQLIRKHLIIHTAWKIQTNIQYCIYQPGSWFLVQCLQIEQKIFHTQCSMKNINKLLLCLDKTRPLRNCQSSKRRYFCKFWQKKNIHIEARVVYFSLQLFFVQLLKQFRVI